MPYDDSDRAAHFKIMAWLKSATPKHVFEISVRAGIYNEDGSLTKQYGGKVTHNKKKRSKS